MGKHIPVYSPLSTLSVWFCTRVTLVLFLFVIACVLKCLLDVLMGGRVNLVAWQEEGFSLSVSSFAGRFRPPDP